ncbi:MAG: hypothetical protein R2681_01245 [Pyrinomonadaceae bacterium]
MTDREFETHVPLFRFLNKHKWMIIVPVLFCVIYFGISLKPNYMPATEGERITAGLSGEIEAGEKENIDARNEIIGEIKSIQRNIGSEAFLKRLILRNDLFRKERADGIDLGHLARSLQPWIHLNMEDRVERGIYFSAFILLDRRDQDQAAGVNMDLNEEFSAFSGTAKLSSFGGLSSSQPGATNMIFYLKLLIGLSLGFLISVLLIILRESPNLFYSEKTREEVFKPIISDWELERSELGLKSHFLRRVVIDMRFGLAFVSAMLRRNPLGDLVELGLRRVR